MFYGCVEQFQLYDHLLMTQRNWKIEDMVMEASKALYKHIKKDQRVLIICGHGNNGADGLALALLLNKNVKVYLVGENDKYSTANEYYQNELKKQNISMYQSLDLFDEHLNECDVIVDGIFGTGFKGEVSKYYRDIVHRINCFKDKKEIISIDIPSCLEADYGIGESVIASKTVSFMACKLGYLNPECKNQIGKLVIEEILLDEELIHEVGFHKIVDSSQIEKILKDRLYNGYKGTYGVLSCYVGSREYPGAALISIGAALNTGCGIVQANVDSFLNSLIIQNYPEVVINNQLSKKDAILFGCGKGWNQSTAALLEELLFSSSVPLLIDADGINCLSENIDLLNHKTGDVILTPHIGEMQRLCGKGNALSAIQFARTYNVIVVLKGPHTLVTDGNKTIRIPSGNKYMAVAGMGDCLAGIIASLLAQKYDIFDACVLGCYLHGLIGDELSKTQYTVLPTEMIKLIPCMMQRINKNNHV